MEKAIQNGVIETNAPMLTVSPGTGSIEEGITVLMAHKSYLEKRRVEWGPVHRKIV